MQDYFVGTGRNWDVVPNVVAPSIGIEEFVVSGSDGNVCTVNLTSAVELILLPCPSL
jgi:hypothetical protein